MGNSISGDERNKALQLKFDKEKIPGFKVVLIGEPRSGKTSVFLRYARNQFDFSYRPTQRAYVENVIKKINLPRDMVAGITLWDLPGQEDMDLRESYYRNADAAIVVVDMTDDGSIELASTWKQEFLNKVSRVQLVSEKSPNGVVTPRHQKLPCDKKSIPVLLLGNKYDLVEEEIRASKIKEALKEQNLSLPDSDDEEVERDHSRLPAVPPEMDAVMRKDNEDEARKDEDDNEEDDADFAPQRGPGRREKKPPCVELLEKVEKEHNFVGSIMVSAKDGDNSVHAAVQSLVRYLIERSQPSTSVKKKVKEKRRRAIVEEEQDVFTLTGARQLDNLFSRGAVPMKRSRDYTEYYATVLRRWKQCCLDHEYLTEIKASLEDTIIGFRDRLAGYGHSLQARQKEDVVELYVKRDPSNKIPDDVPVALRTFNTEYAPMCKVILRDAPVIQTFLNNLDSKLEQQSKELWDGRDETNGKHIERTLDICEQNRAKIWQCKSQNQEVLTTAVNAQTKIKTALAW